MFVCCKKNYAGRNQDYRNEYLEYAHKLLVYFVATSKDLYSDSFCSCNVHGLIHLHDDVTNFGCSLDILPTFRDSSINV